MMRINQEMGSKSVRWGEYRAITSEPTSTSNLKRRMAPYKPFKILRRAANHALLTRLYTASIADCMKLRKQIMRDAKYGHGGVVSKVKRYYAISQVSRLVKDQASTIAPCELRGQMRMALLLRDKAALVEIIKHSAVEALSAAIEDSALLWRWADHISDEQYTEIPFGSSADKTSYHHIMHLLAQKIGLDRMGKIATNVLFDSIQCPNNFLTNIIIQMLIDLGANIDQRDEQGKTPLIYAVLNDSQMSVKALLYGGADLSVKDASGNNAIHYAQHHEWTFKNNRSKTTDQRQPQSNMILNAMMSVFMRQQRTTKHQTT